MLRIGNMKYGDRYHPFRAIGRWMFLFCLLFIAFAQISGIIPESFQPFAVVVICSIMIFSGVLGLWGSFKSFDRSAYPVFLAFAIILTVVFSIWIFTHLS
jgi:hypothetical protein